MNGVAYKPTALLVLFFIVLAMVGINVVYVVLDHTPFLWDAVGHYIEAKYFQQCLHPIVSLYNSEFAYKPTLVSMLAALSLHPVNIKFEPEIVLVVIMLFYAVLIVSVYASTRLIAPRESEMTALVAAVIAATSPSVYSMARNFMPDLPLAACVWASIAFLLAAIKDNRWWAFVGMGVCAAAGMLCKQSFPIFFALPVAVGFYWSLSQSKEKGRTLAHWLLSFAVLAAIGLPWYINNFLKSYHYYIEHGMTTDISRIRQAFPYYPAVLWEEHLGLVLTVLSFGGMLLLLLRRRMLFVYSRLLLLGLSMIAVDFFISAWRNIIFHVSPLPPCPFSPSRFRLAGWATAWIKKGGNEKLVLKEIF
ncbi:MAG TPA: glycosyltransferase family 39 protein [bacterium]|nr:glycosyltransferase family 39 protein [bacterium]